MKRLNLTLIVAFAIVTLSGCCTICKKELSAEEKAKQAKIAAAMPFDISIGGQKAQLNTEFCAKIPAPVTDTAEILLDEKIDGDVFLTIFPATKEGLVKPGKKPTVVSFTKGQKNSLDKTDNEKKLKPGLYIMNIDVDNQIASIVLEIKK